MLCIWDWRKLYIGDATGNGIYKSTDGGGNWSLIYGPGGTVVQ